MDMRHDNYLESKVLTAPPHRLQLMLIEGALRFGRQAEEALERDDQTAASAALLRVIDIVGELLAGARESKTELNKKIADFYLFLFRLVSEAKINNDVEKLAEARRLLDYERHTWELVCDKLGSEAASVAPQSVAPTKSATQRPPIASSLDMANQQSNPAGLSLEA